MYVYPAPSETLAVGAMPSPLPCSIKAFLAGGAVICYIRSGTKTSPPTKKKERREKRKDEDNEDEDEDEESKKERNSK